MSSATAPYPYFNGITYNPSFFSSSSTSLTQGQANLLYLRKTTADTATALETFSGGLSSTTVDSTTATTDMTIGSNLTNGDLTIGGTQTGGDINIGVNATRNAFGYIRIGSADTASASVPIIIGNVNSTTAMKGTCSFSNEISATGISSTANIAVTGTSTITAPSGGSLIGPYQNKATANTPNATINTSGAITGTSLSLGTGSIACGGITTSGIGLITANSGVKSSSYDASDTIAGQTALTIGSSVVHGNIVIGNAQTDGDIIIGASDISGATITVGTASTATTINGSLTVNNGISFPLLYTPTSTQLGYNNSAGVTTPVTGIGAAGSTLITITNLAIGIYLVTFSATLNTFSATTGMFIQTTYPVTGGCTTLFDNTQYQGSVNVTGISTTATVICTTATNTCSFRIATNTGTVTANNSKYSYIKIA